VQTDPADRERDGPISTKTTADAVIVTAPHANIERFFERPDVLKPLFSALRRQHERGALLLPIAPASLSSRSGPARRRRCHNAHGQAKVFCQALPRSRFGFPKL